MTSPYFGMHERVEADDGYVGEHPRYIKCPGGLCNPEETEAMQQRVRNRQETVNKRFKNWGAMKQVWRHLVSDRGVAFRACTIICQLQINEGELLFQVGYRDPPY